jgi:hypothetical protein
LINPGRATLYDGVGVVKRHFQCTSRERLVFFLPRSASENSSPIALNSLETK